MVNLTEETSGDSDIYLADQDTVIVSQVPEADQMAEAIRVSPHSDIIDCTPECEVCDVSGKESYRESCECSYDPEDSDSSSSAATTFGRPSPHPDISLDFVPPPRNLSKGSSSHRSTSAPPLNTQPHHDTTRVDTIEDL